MDQDGSLEISYDEWRSFFLNNPLVLDRVTTDPREMLRYWKNNSVRCERDQHENASRLSLD